MWVILKNINGFFLGQEATTSDKLFFYGFYATVFGILVIVVGGGN